MALALESLTFSVETKELENAILKMKELGQAASSLNKPIEQLGKQASESAKKVEKVAQAADKLAASAERSKSSTKNLGKSTEDLGEETDVVANKIERLSKQLAYLRNDQQLSTTGFTKSQAGIMAWADAAGATADQLKGLSQIQDQFNRIMGEQALDKSVAGLNMLNRQLKEFGIMQELAGGSAKLTSVQVKQLARDMEVLRQQNIAIGKDSESGISQLKSDFTQAAAEVNKLVAASKAQQKAAEEQANSAIQLAAAQSSLIQKEKDLAFVTQKVHEGFSKTVAGGMLKFSKLLQQSGIEASKASQMLNKYASDLQKLESLGKKTTQLEATSVPYMDDAVILFRNRQAKAIDDVTRAEAALIEQEQRLQFVTQKTSDGFTVASANSLYRYQESLKRAGVTEQEFIARSSAYASALKARQTVSDDNKQRTAAAQELLRIEQQLGDQEKFVAYAIAETNKQQQQATAGAQQFADTLNIGSLRALFAYEQALRRAGVAEAEVTSKSEQMRQQMLKMQQATESFNGSVNHIGRNIGVQFTDIFVSLYNGQPVMQVITQQGGQLADAFLLAGVSGQNMSQHLVAGFKNILESYKLLFAAFAGLAGAGIAKVFSTLTPDLTTLQLALDKSIPKTERFSFVMSELSNVMTATAKATAFLAVTTGVILAVEAYKSVKAYDELTTNLIRYGGAIYGGIEGTKEYANELQRAGWSAGQASEFITAVAKAGNLSSEQMQEMASVAKDLDTWLNISFEDTAKLYSEIKKAPLDTIIKLAKETGLVSDAVVENIIQYERAGNVQGAVMAAMNEATRVHGEQVKLAEKNYSDFARTVIKVGEAVRKGYQNLFAYFVEASTPEDLLKTQLESVEETLSGKGILSKMSLALMPEQAKKDLMVQRDQLKAQLELLKQQREEQVKIAEQSQRNKENSAANLKIQQQLQTGLNKPDAKKLNQEQYVNAFLEEQRRLNKGIILDEQTIKMYREQAIKDWKSANESNTRARTSFSTKTSNEVQEVKRQYDQELQLEQKLLSDKLAVMKNYHDNGFTKTSEYLSREQQLVIASRNKQLQILEQYNKDELAAFDNKAQALNAAAANAIKDGGNAAAINKQLGKNLEDLNRQRQTFIESISGKEEKVWSSSLKELSKNMDDVAATTAGVIKVANDYSNEIEKQQINRQAEIEMTRESIALSEKEIAVLKAKTEAEKQYNAVIKKLERGVEDASNMMLDFYNNLDMSDFGAIETSMDRGWQLYVQYEKAKEALTKARLQGEEEQRNAVSDAALAYELQNYKKLKDGIADAIATALFEGGEEGKKQLRDIIVAELRKPITLEINAFVNSVLSDVIGLPGNDSSGQGTNSGILGNLSSLNSAYKLINNSISSSITKGFTSFATSDVGIKMGLGTSNASAVGPVKPGLTSTGTAVSSALTMAGNATAGYGIQKSISGGYKTGESGLVDAATVIASAIYGPLAGVATGVFNRAFGRKLKDQGIEGTFGTSDGFDGNTYEFYKGGWLRSDKTKRKPMDAGVEDALETQFKTLQTQTALMAQTLGLSTDSVVNFTSKIKISFKGLSEEQISQRMAEEFGKVAESMASVALGETEYARTGETAVETLTRLSSSLTTVNGTFDVLGQTLYASSLVGADMASQLVDLMGGLENFTNITASYYENFYTEAERADTATRQLTEALTSIGIDTMPATRDAYRDLVEAQDLTTESGRETFAALMQLSTAFASVTTESTGFINEITKWYEDLLGRAPDSSGFDYWSNQVSSGIMSMEKAAEAFNIQSNMELLQRQLLELIDPQKALNEARARELSLLPESQRAIQQHIWVRQDELKVLEQRTSLEDKLLQITENSSAIRAKERSEIHASNLALFDLVKSFEDLNELSSQLDTALSNAASAAEKVKSIQDKATENYLSAQDKVKEAQQKIKDIQNENLKEQIEKAKELSSAFKDLSKDLRSFVFGEIKPSSQLFEETMKQAIAGNQEAMKALPDAASAAIEQVKKTSGTLEEFERKRAEILAGVMKVSAVADSKALTQDQTVTKLEAKLTPEQTAMQQAQQDLKDAIKEQAAALEVANAIQAPLTQSIEDLISEYKIAKQEQSEAVAEVSSLSTQLTNLATATADLATATGNLPAALAAISINAEANIESSITMATASDLPVELKQIALASLNTLQSNFETVTTNKSMPPVLREIALGAISSNTSNFGVIATTTTLPEELKQLALGASAAVTSNINTVVTQAANGTIPASIAELALKSSTGISTTITTTVSEAANGAIPKSIAELVLNSVNGLSTDVTANVIQSGALDDAAKATILSASDTIAKTFNVTVQTAANTTVPAVISDLALKTNQQLAKTLGVTVALANDATIPQEIITLAGTASDTLGKTLSVTLAAAQSGAMPTWVTQLALESTNNASKIVDVAISQAADYSTTPWITNLKLLTGEIVGKTVQIAMGGDPTLTAAQAALKITSADNILKTVDLALSDSKLTADEIALLNSITSSIGGEIALKFNPDAETKSLWEAIVKSTALTVNALYAVHNAVLSLGRAQGLTGLSGDIAGIFSADEAKLFAESFRQAAGTTSSTTEIQAWSSWLAQATPTTTPTTTPVTTPTTPTTTPVTTPTTPTTTPVTTPDYTAQAARVLDDIFVLSRNEAGNAIQTRIWDAYVQYGHRVPDQGGYDWWYSAISSGARTIQQFEDSLLSETKNSAKSAIYNELVKNGVNAEIANTLAGQYSFSEGGYTGHGGKYQPAGIVHAGEVVFSQNDIARLGGVGVVEGIRTGEIPMFANGGIVQPVSAASASVMQQDNSELIQELQSLREEVKMLRAEARVTALNTGKTSRILDDVTQGGTEVKVVQTDEFISLLGK